MYECQDRLSVKWTSDPSELAWPIEARRTDIGYVLLQTQVARKCYAEDSNMVASRESPVTVSIQSWSDWPRFLRGAWLNLDPAQSSSVLFVFNFRRLADIQLATSVMQCSSRLKSYTSFPLLPLLMTLEDMWRSFQCKLSFLRSIYQKHTRYLQSYWNYL